MTSVRRALAISFLERYLTVVLALGSNMLLARLLTPHEIGVYSVSLAVIGIAQVLREFGIGNYLIQEKELTDDHLRTAFGISLLLGGSLFLVVVVAAPYAAGFYGEPAMTKTLRIAALNFLVLPFCTVRLALLRRAMRFKPLLYVSLVATVLSQVVTVGLAWGGFGPDSMAIGSVVMNVVMAIGTFVAHDDKRVLAPSLKKWRPLMSFGGQSAATSVVTTIAMDSNDLILGKVLGFGPVALLSRAQGLINLFHRDVMGAVRNVALPAFSQAHREGQDVPRQFRKSLTVLTVVAWPFYGFVAIYSLEFMRLLFGSQWDAAAALVPVFALAGVIGSFNSLVPTLLIALGRIETVTKLELTMQPLRVAMLLVFLYVSTTMASAAWALVAIGCIGAPAYLLAAARVVPGLLSGLSRDLVTSLAVTLAAVAPAVIHRLVSAPPMPSLGRYVEMAVVMGTGVILGVITAERLRHPLALEPAYLSIRQRLLRLLTSARS